MSESQTLHVCQIVNNSRPVRTNQTWALLQDYLFLQYDEIEVEFDLVLKKTTVKANMDNINYQTTSSYTQFWPIHKMGLA